MTTDVLPILLLILVALVVPPWSARGRLCSVLMTTGFLAILARYLWWRLSVTVLPADGATLGTLFVWLVFLAELWLWYEALNLVAILLRRTDRSGEADVHEARLAATPSTDLPHVDVLIATYNEPLDVLEKTIAGALALDWPADRLHVHVLDDGRRGWLAGYCALRDVRHLTRADNTHAKAGNINAAIPRTSSPFMLVLDADFVPQRRMLMRAIGFFDDPGIGIVQMPHHFFNSTPLQTNLDMRATLPDEQRFFFDIVQPGRDGWDCAFCCGSNGIIRRAAIDAVGGAMPTESITEDMLLTLAMLRKGYIIRYLGERLAIGLAPETLDAYFVQRARWAQGAIQLLYTRRGPLGPGLSPVQRVFFNPSRWLSQSICQPLAMATPAIFLLTGLPPLLHATLAEILAYQLPAIAAAYVFVHFLAPRDFAPVASTVEAVLQSFRLMPVVLLTLVKPRGHGFKVTPKGSDAGLSREDRFTIRIAFLLLMATGLGLLINAGFSLRRVDTGDLLPVVAFWSVFNMIVLLMVMTAAVPRPVFRKEERFDLSEPCRLVTPNRTFAGDAINMSLTGLLVAPDAPALSTGPGCWIGIELAGVGIVPGQVRRVTSHGGAPALGIALSLPSGPCRDAVIRKLFTSLPGRAPATAPGASGLTMLARIFARAPTATPPEFDAGQGETPPDWLTGLTGPMTYPPPVAKAV
jgi:cellulose synthase/poly-beta-1,6-N-acetylglucosamine synthase-like glycosyltransferase